MTREEAAINAEILKAFSVGKDIQLLRGNSWVDIEYPSFIFDKNKYRIKPESKYVPFTFEDSKLFRDKWIVLKEEYGSSKRLTRIFGIYEDHVNHISGNYIYNIYYKDLLKMYTFEDGTPCGKQIE